MRSLRSISSFSISTSKYSFSSPGKRQHHRLLRSPLWIPAELEEYDLPGSLPVSRRHPQNLQWEVRV